MEKRLSLAQIRLTRHDLLIKVNCQAKEHGCILSGKKERKIEEEDCFEVKPEEFLPNRQSVGART